MLSLNSKKVSLGVLAALVGIDWYVLLQAQNNHSVDIPTSADATPLSQSLPTLRIVELPAALMPSKLFNFSATERALHIQDLQSLTAIPPLQVARVSLPAQQVQESPNYPGVSDTQTQLSVAEPDMEQPIVQPSQAHSSARSRSAADTPQAANLLKLLALYSMLHR